jgi:hypothetical protein
MTLERELEQHEDEQEHVIHEQHEEEAPVDLGAAGGLASETTMASKNERPGHRLRGRQMS